MLEEVRDQPVVAGVHLPGERVDVGVGGAAAGGHVDVPQPFAGLVDGDVDLAALPRQPVDVRGPVDQVAAHPVGGDDGGMLVGVRHRRRVVL
jgi:hypothetical protein